jgi:D-alanyl-D-alanine carboxypeptidase
MHICNVTHAVRRCLAITAIVFFWAALVCAQVSATLSPDAQRAIDDAARSVLSSTGVPSASLTIVQDGRVAYVQAYGRARLDPPAPANPAMRYSIGSVSKQFTAAAILMLAEDGKLSLDDPVAHFLPGLTRASEVSVRQLLSHTSGYQDYWPQDYVPPFMLQPVTAADIMDRWARKPLDFDPGTKWEYSNTNYVIAGAIVEKASGMTLLDFLNRRIFEPLGMTRVADVDQARLGAGDPVGYMRYALGPPRVAPKEGKGWLFAAGELAMTAEDLARWDLGIIGQRLLKPSSYKEMQSAVLLKNGVAVRYGLGMNVGRMLDRRVLEHGGEVSGFTAENMIFPDDRAAVIVLCNQDSSDTAATIAEKIAPLLFASPAADHRRQAQEIFEGLQQGKLDRKLFTTNGNSYFNEQAIRDFSTSLAALGKPQSFEQVAQERRGGMIYRSYEAKFGQRTLRIWTYELPDGKLEQYEVAPSE